MGLRAIKNKLLNNSGLFSTLILRIWNKTHNQIKKSKSNLIELHKGCYLRNCHIDLRGGKHNKLIIKSGAQLINTKIDVEGSNNVIEIGGKARLYKNEIQIKEDNNRFIVGEKCFFNTTKWWIGESKNIVVGNSCWIAVGCHFRTTDGHSLLDIEGNRINPAADIVIGDHCWIGTNTVCLKGVTLQPNTIVSACSLLNKRYEHGNVVLGGVPARVLKENVQWRSYFVPIGKEKHE